jgi:YHS domain-containing protein
MEVDEAKAKAAGLVSEFQGKTYYFCAAEDKAAFDKGPARYTSKVSKGAASEAGKRLEQVEWKAPQPAEPSHASHDHDATAPHAGHSHVAMPPASSASHAVTRP